MDTRERKIGEPLSSVDIKTRGAWRSSWHS